MGHSVTGFIISENQTSFAQAFDQRLVAVLLKQNFYLFPLTPDMLDSIFPPPQVEWMEGFVYLSGGLQGFLKNLSHIGPTVYFETDYCGGKGSQAAIVFDQGKIAWGPQAARRGPINTALQYLGVIPLLGKDEFESVGLHIERDTESWLGIP